MEHPREGDGDINWDSLLNEDVAEDEDSNKNYSGPDSILNLGSAIIGMAVAEKPCSIDRKARGEKKKPAIRFENLGRKIQPENPQALNGNDGVISKGLPPVVLTEDSPAVAVTKSQMKGKNLFERVHDPDNCFENAYSSVQPDANSRMKSRNLAANTVGFNEARIYDSSDRSNASKSHCTSETAECSTASTKPSAISIRNASSEKSHVGDMKILSSQSNCNGALREAKSTSARGEIPGKILRAQSVDKNIVKPNGRVGRAETGSGQTKPFFPSRNIDLSKMTEAKAQPTGNGVTEASESVRSSSRQSLTESTAATTNKTSNSALKRDQIGPIFAERSRTPMLPTMDNDTPPVSRPEFSISKSKSHSIMSEDVIEQNRFNGYRPKKPFVPRALPSWSERMTKAAKKIDKMESQTESMRTIHQCETASQVRKSQQSIDKETESEIV